MKGFPAASAPPAPKRRWKCFSKAIPVAVFFSLVVTLTFVLGLHNRFPSGYFTDERPPLGPSFGTADGGREQNSVEGDEMRITNLMGMFAPAFSKDVLENITRQVDGNLYHGINSSISIYDQPTSKLKDATSIFEQEDNNSKGLPRQENLVMKSPSAAKKPVGGRVEKYNPQSPAGDETEKSCQLEFGSYCLWSIQYKVPMRDFVVKTLKDQLFVARSYFPSIAKLKDQDKLSRAMKRNIQDHERMLSEAISDVDLPSFVEKKREMMEQTLSRAKSCKVDCHNVEKKLAQILDLTDDEAHFHMKQSAFLYHLGVQTIPRSFHCLSMRLTVEYFKSSSVDTELPHAHKFDSPALWHYVIFSRNILAASVVVNSTLTHSEGTGIMVFHLLTDGQNFYAMKSWFLRNPYRDAVIQVLNIEDLHLAHSYNLGPPLLSPSEEFRVSIRNNNQPPPAQTRTVYISVFGHSHFLLPEIFKNLKKVVVLDDDMVVQRDLSSLWNIDLEGKVIGAVEFCGVRLAQLKNYLGENSFDANSCAWMSGVNIVDLEKWRERGIAAIYQQLLHKFYNGSEASWRAAALPSSLLAFQGLIFPLDNTWVVSGLGHDYKIKKGAIKNAIALHYNGNMKPWLDLGIPFYKKYWKKFLAQGEQFMDQCNVNH